MSERKYNPGDEVCIRGVVERVSGNNNEPIYFVSPVLNYGPYLKDMESWPLWGDDLSPAPDAATEADDVLARLGWKDGATVAIEECWYCGKAKTPCRANGDALLLNWQCIDCKEKADAETRQEG